MAENKVTKKKVTMRNLSARTNPDGEVEVLKHEAVDYVREDFLDAYLEVARRNWQEVEVSEEYDAGPGGYDGATYVPEGLDHPDAGKTFPAIEKDGK